MRKPSLVECLCVGAMLSMLAILCDKVFQLNLGVAVTALCLLQPFCSVVLLLFLANADQNAEQKPKINAESRRGQVERDTQTVG